MDVEARRTGRELAGGGDLGVRGGEDEPADHSGRQGLALHARHQALARLVDGRIVLGKFLQFPEVFRDGLGTFADILDGAQFCRA